MKNWFNKNYKTLIISAFLIPIIIVAFVSISHVTVWYDISNPDNWAAYLSVGIEIAALSALAAISANMGRKVYFPFVIVTLIQFIGNIFFAYQYIDINGKLFRNWVELVAPLLSTMGVEETDFIGHKRFLSLFSGGLLPMISLSFLHMLVKFSEENKTASNNNNILEEEKKKWEGEFLEKIKSEAIDSKDIVSEVSKVRLSEEELKQLEAILLNPPPPNDDLKSAANDYNSIVDTNKDEDNKSGSEIISNELYQESEDENMDNDIEDVLDSELIELIESKNETPIELDETNIGEVDSIDESVELLEITETVVPEDVIVEEITTPQPIQPVITSNQFNDLEEKKNS
jgi:hypothetical protein